MWWILWVACTTRAEQERVAYMLASSGKKEAISACSQLKDPQVAGDCLGVLATALKDGDTAGEVCDAVTDPVWKGECHFIRAESYVEAGNLEAAVGACHQAGPFVKDCARHLWQDIHRENPGSLPDILARLAQEFPELAPALDPNQTQMQVQLEKEYLRAFDRLSVALCEGRSEACLEAISWMLSARWRRAAQGNPAVMQVLCTTPINVPDASTFEKLAYQPDPRLDQAISETRAALCVPVRLP